MCLARPSGCITQPPPQPALQNFSLIFTNTLTKSACIHAQSQEMGWGGVEVEERGGSEWGGDGGEKENKRGAGKGGGE